MFTSAISHAIFFLLSLAAAFAMLSEALWILVLRKQITPIPSRVLYGIGSVALGSEKSKQFFTGRTTAPQLRTYAKFTLVFGACILLSSFVYLFSVVL